MAVVVAISLRPRHPAALEAIPLLSLCITRRVGWKSANEALVMPVDRRMANIATDEKVN
jgi:hypothetical protein